MLRQVGYNGQRSWRLLGGEDVEWVNRLTVGTSLSHHVSHHWHPLFPTGFAS